MMKQDRGGVRTAQGLERKYNIGGMQKTTKKSERSIASVEQEMASNDKEFEALKEEVNGKLETVNTEMAELKESIDTMQCIDVSNTSYVSSFLWSEETYPGSTNPSLDGKPVLVLAVKNKEEVQYNFVVFE